MSWNKSVPSSLLQLPSGGASLAGMGETFEPEAFTGASGFRIPLCFSEGRDGFGPTLSLRYNSSAGNGPFGLGWSLDLPCIHRLTDRGVPAYGPEDPFALSGSGELVPGSPGDARTDGGYRVRRFFCRDEGEFSRIELWELESASARNGNLSPMFWRVTSRNNITSFLGLDEGSVIRNPSEPGNVFTWNVRLMLDGKGNAIGFDYKSDKDGIQEFGRAIASQNAQMYLKRILYGNRRPLLAQAPEGLLAALESRSGAEEWFFEALLDYGEHGPQPKDAEVSTSDFYEESQAWPVRQDPFSNCRGGFDLRTLRLCRRILMFHHVPHRASPLLVRSTDLSYEALDHNEVSVLASATLRGYKGTSDERRAHKLPQETGGERAEGSAYEVVSTPPIRFSYLSFAPASRDPMPLQFGDGYGPHSGLGDADHALVDLFGRGVPDLIESANEGFYYWKNLGDCRFGARLRLEHAPFQRLSDDGVGFISVSAKGVPDLGLFQPPPLESGYCETTEEGGWGRFTRFGTQPDFSLRDPSLRLIDLTGDGLLDAVRTDADNFWIHESQGPDGYSLPRKIRKIPDLSLFPFVDFDDSRVLFADMNGDGLTDIVLMDVDEIHYWPNLGHGQFGPRVTMRDAPYLGRNPERVFLVDLDGSGTADLVFVELGRVRFWINKSGDAWGSAHAIENVPALYPATDVQAVDLLGGGANGLLWSYPGGDYRYLPLCEHGQAGLLEKIDNSLGLTSSLVYRPSTQLRLESEGQGKRCLGWMPITVQVLVTVRHAERVTGSKYASHYSYAHGIYDVNDRQFRGFARTDQLDAETAPPSEASSALARRIHVEPVLVRSWFHPGIEAGHSELIESLKAEWFAFPGVSSVGGADFPANRRGAARCLAGALLRRETYKGEVWYKDPPSLVSESRFIAVEVQPPSELHPGSFARRTVESLEVNGDRGELHGPRLSYLTNLEFDEFGHVLRAMAVDYGNPDPQHAEQSLTFATCKKQRFVNRTGASDAYFVGLRAETIEYDVPHSLMPTAELLSGEQWARATTDLSKLIPQAGTRSYHDDRPLGEVGAYGLLTKELELVFTSEMMESVYDDRVTASELIDLGYEISDLPSGHHGWWRCAQAIGYDSQRFHLPIEYRDPLGHPTRVDYDPLIVRACRIERPLGNSITARIDYRTLLPTLVIDINGNQTDVRYDALGRATAVAYLGKVGRNEADTIEHPSEQFQYNLSGPTRSSEGAAIEPAWVRRIRRERYYADEPKSRHHEEISYFDGLGRRVQTKESIGSGSTERDWRTTGWELRNNKGWLTAECEPFFSETKEFENLDVAIAHGVCKEIEHDPLGRVTRTFFPDGTWTKFEWTPWTSTEWDRNDTLTDQTDSGGAYDHAWYGRKLSGSPTEQEIARDALEHAETPTVTEFDARGRWVCRIRKNSAEASHVTRATYDARGNVASIIDPRGIVVLRDVHDLLDRPLRHWHADSGERVELLDAAGNTRKCWDGRGFLREHEYDDLNRPTHVWVTEPGGTQRRLARVTYYGESLDHPESQNLRGEVYQVCDAAGTIEYPEYNIKGKIQTVRRKLAARYGEAPDWSSLDQVEFLPGPPFTTSMGYDALDRLVRLETPDGAIQHRSYDLAGNVRQIQLRPSTGAPIPLLRTADYNARGQITRMECGEGLVREWKYDASTSRIQSMRAGWNDRVLQDLVFQHDPVGNVMAIDNYADQTLFFKNRAVSPNRRFRYDALYRLVWATGREHEALWNYHDPDGRVLPHVNEHTAALRYVETYGYDLAGNMRERRRKSGDHQIRLTFDYANDSNRLKKSTTLRETERAFSYETDDNGNHVKFAHLKEMTIDFCDRLVAAEIGGGGRAWYAYGGGGDCVRRVVKFQNGVVRERIYIGALEYLNEYPNSDALDERRPSVVQVLHRLEANGEILATLTTNVVDQSRSEGQPRATLAFHINDHQHSCALEISRNGRVVSYEEFAPHGQTVYFKRYRTPMANGKTHRYLGRELDEATGLYMLGVRLYSPYVGRWLSCDPAGVADGLNLYVYARNSPVSWSDPRGLVSSRAFDRSERDRTGPSSEGGTVGDDISDHGKRAEPVVSASDSYGASDENGYIEYDPSTNVTKIDFAPSTITGSPPPDVSPPRGIVHEEQASYPDDRYFLDPLHSLPMLRPGFEEPSGSTISKYQGPPISGFKHIDPDDVRPEFGAPSKNELLMWMATGQIIRANPIASMAIYGKAAGSEMYQAAQRNVGPWGVFGAIGQAAGNRFIGGDPLTPSWIGERGVTARAIKEMHSMRGIDGGVSRSQREIMKRMNETLDKLPRVWEKVN